jgi:hypothetical protein
MPITESGGARSFCKSLHGIASALKYGHVDLRTVLNQFLGGGVRRVGNGKLWRSTVLSKFGSAGQEEIP